MFRKRAGGAVVWAIPGCLMGIGHLPEFLCASLNPWTDFLRILSVLKYAGFPLQIQPGNFAHWGKLTCWTFTLLATGYSGHNSGPVILPVLGLEWTLWNYHDHQCDPLGLQVWALRVSCPRARLGFQKILECCL